MIRVNRYILLHIQQPTITTSPKTWSFNIASVGPRSFLDVMMSYRFLIIRRFFWCLVEEKLSPAKKFCWITSSTKDNFWQLPGRFWTPVQLIVMIYTLESIDQWFGKPRKDNNASIPMNSGKKMDHFHHKSLFATDLEFMNRKQSIDFAVFSSHRNIHQLRELLLYKSYFAFLAVKSH